MEESKMESCIKIIRKLPVSQMEKNLTAISTLIYDDDDVLNNFLQVVDNRHDVCEENNFIKSEHNRDGDSYRSPITNKYYPPIEDGRMPSKELRVLEEKLNKIFGLYTNAYYASTNSQGLCSCYCWDLGEGVEDGFAVAVLIRHALDGKSGIESGLWESSNVVDVTFSNGKCHYKLTTSILLKLTFSQSCGKGNISGTIAEQVF